MAKLGKPAAAILVMAAIIAVLLTLCTPRSTSKSSSLGDAGQAVRRTAAPVRVLVLDFSPVITDSASRPVHAAFGWRDPRELAAEYATDVQRASASRVRYDIVEWRIVREFPLKRDGFRYTPASYAACLRQPKTCHAPDALDYERVLADQHVPALVNARAIDEVWLFGGPYFGYFEATMAGPGSFDINGGPFPNVASSRAFAIMGFNYERGVAEMLHDLCHRAEATMARVYGGWESSTLTTNWARFAASARQSNGRAGVGGCHSPPNATADYEYDNPRVVESDADDWLRYPALTGARARVSRDSWGGPDYHRQYMRWWLAHLPRRDGIAPDGKLNNWWAYVTGFDSLLIDRQ